MSALEPIALTALTGVSQFRSDARYAIVEAAPPTALPDIAEPDELPPADPYAQGWEDGHQAALTEARLEMARRLAAEAEARDAVRLCMTRIDEALEARLRERLHETVVALCEATLAPLALDPDALARRVARAAAMLARAEDERVVRLHPDDLALIGDRLGGELTLQPDASLSRGAVRIEGAAGGVEDGPEQWRAALAAALGDTRAMNE